MTISPEVEHNSAIGSHKSVNCGNRHSISHMHDIHRSAPQMSFNK